MIELYNRRICVCKYQGNAVENALPVGKDVADKAFATAACIGCGHCVTSCKNSSANLFVSAKKYQFCILPQGLPKDRPVTLGILAQNG